MNIAGPIFDPQRRTNPKKWFLRFYVPALKADGSIDHDAPKKPKRPYYRTKELAEADKPRLLAQYDTAGSGGELGVITRAQVEDLEKARREAPGVPMLELAKFWRLHHPTTATLTIGQHAPAFVAWARSRLGDTRHTSDLKSRMDIFARRFGERLPATFTRAEFLDYLLTLGKAGRTVLNMKRVVVNFFNWLVDVAKVIPTNPLAGIKKRSLPKDVPKEIAFLSLVAANRYLRAAERYDPDLIAHEIIQLLAGVRADDEMEDFRGEFVKADTREVVIPAEIAKTEKREVIDSLEDSFWAWWKHYGRTGLLRPKNYLQRWHRLRVLSEVEPRAKADELARLPIKSLLKLPEAKATMKAWPWNARRRTFCTYHVAKHQSADKTALILRHRGEASTLHNSYRGLGVTKDQGDAYFAIAPAAVPRVIWPARPARGIVRLQATRAEKIPPAAAAVA